MVVLTTTQGVNATISYFDANGNPARIDGAPSWSSSDETIVKLANLSPDGFSTDVLAAGVIGSAQVNVSADVDLGQGTKPLISTLAVQVAAGEAVSASISTGEHFEQTTRGGDKFTRG